MEDTTYKLDPDTTSEYGRYVKSIWDPCGGALGRARFVMLWGGGGEGAPGEIKH